MKKFEIETFGGSLRFSAKRSKTGRIVRCDKWNEDRWVECGGGIHFYLTRAEAEAHL